MLKDSSASLDQLIASPFSSHIAVKGTFWGRTYSCLWAGIDATSSELSNAQLCVALERTLSVFCYAISEMAYTQMRYKRLLADIVNAKNNNTTDLEHCRAKLKHIYDNISPFFKQLTRTKSNLFEVFYEHMKHLNTRNYASKHSHVNDMYQGMDKNIRALIHVECLVGKLLPYNKIFGAMTSFDHEYADTLRSLVAQVAPQTQFKKVYQTLLTIMYASGINARIDYVIYHLYTMNIPLIEYSEPKYLAYRATLQPGQTITLKKINYSVTLADRIGEDRGEKDDRVVFRSQNRPDIVVAFYRNRLMHKFNQIRIGYESYIASSPRTHYSDDKGIWSTEECINPAPIPFNTMLMIINKIIEDGRAHKIPFTQLSIDPKTQQIMCAKPIIQQNEDFDGFVDSLIELYNTGCYSNNYRTLYVFLRICLDKIQDHRAQFFKDLVLAAAKLPINVFPSEIALVIETAVGKKYLITSVASEDSIRNKCAHLVDEVLEERMAIVQEYRKTAYPQAAAEQKLIDDFAIKMSETVCTWILPPKTQ